MASPNGGMTVDDIQLPRWADQFICCQAAFYAQVVVNMYLDLTFVGYGHPLDDVVRYWCPVLARMGVRLGRAAWVLRACSWHNMASGSHLDMTGTFCRSAALAASYRAPGSLRDMRVPSALMTSWVCALAAPGGPLARRGSRHCPRRSLRLIAVAIICSSGIFGSSSRACGTSPDQTVPGGTWLAGLRSCTGHSGNRLSSQSSRFEVSAFSPYSGSACHSIFSCRLPCWPGVASLLCILPRNHITCFCCPSPCTSAPSGHSGCMALRSATVKNGHAWGSGFGCGSSRGGLGPLSAPAWVVWPGGPGCPPLQDEASARAALVQALAWRLASVRCGCERCCMSVLVPHGVGAYLELGSRVLAGWWCEV